MFKSRNMSDKELDKAIASHLANLHDLEIIDHTHKKKPITPELSNQCDLYMECMLENDSKSRMSSERHFNMTLGNYEWKSKTPYSVTDSNYSAEYNFLHSKRNYDSSKEWKTNELKYKSDEKKLDIIDRLRQALSNFQEKQGLSNIDYSFLALMQTMGHIVGTTLLALIYVVVNIFPMIQIVLLIMRFILDKIIKIRNTEDRQQMTLQTIFLMLQLMCVYICLSFIISLIWMPILNMILKIISRCTIDYTTE